MKNVEFCQTQGALGTPRQGPIVIVCTVGGIQALGCLQGPPQTGFGVTQDGPVEVLALFARQSWLANGENFTGRILPDPGCPGDPKIGSYSDCMVSWVSGMWDGFGMMGMMGMLA